jgi:hypothetical protein
MAATHEVLLIREGRDTPARDAPAAAGRRQPVAAIETSDAFDELTGRR